MFTALAVVQIFNALAVRSNTEYLFVMGVFSNRVMWAVIALVAALQLTALYTPLNRFLGLQPLTARDWLLCLGLGAVLLSAVELEKTLIRARSAKAVGNRARREPTHRPGPDHREEEA